MKAPKEYASAPPCAFLRRGDDRIFSFVPNENICHAPLGGAACLLRALRLASAADAQLPARPVIAPLRRWFEQDLAFSHCFLNGAGENGLRRSGACGTSNELGYGLRRAKGMMPSALPACCRRVMRWRCCRRKQQRAISTEKARPALIYGRTGVLYALCSLYLDPSMDSRALTPTRPAGLCRPCRIDEAPAHASGLSPPRVRGSSRG